MSTWGLGVAWLTKRNGDLFVDGPGRWVEPVVQMRRLPGEGMLPNLLDKGAVDVRLVRRIGRQLARFHATAATGEGVDEYGHSSAIRANWDENFAQTASFDERVLPAQARGAIVAHVERFLDQRTSLLERRVAHGRIRRPAVSGESRRRPPHPERSRTRVEGDRQHADRAGRRRCGRRWDAAR